MEDEVLPAIRKRIRVPEVVHRTIMTQGVPESYLAEIIREWESSLPKCVKLAYLPRPGIVRLRLSASGKCAEDGVQILDKLVDKLLEIIPEHIYGYDDISLEQALGDTLKEKNLSLATAESCTGGNIARMITSIPGSSAYYAGSVIAYENRIKTGVLAVDPALLEEKGAVCKEVVEQMARGVMMLLGTDTAITTSGIAGPGGGSDEKPVGTTWICVAHGERLLSQKYQFGGTRERIIDQASNTSLQLLRRLLLKNI
jgi:nicotinamide-nucleotide amidase